MNYILFISGNLVAKFTPIFLIDAKQRWALIANFDPVGQIVCTGRAMHTFLFFAP